MEEVFLRFPHLSENIYDSLNHQSLAKSREVSNKWQTFLDKQKFLQIRVIKETLKTGDSWNATFKKFTTEMIFELAISVKQFARMYNNDYNHKGPELTPTHVAAGIGNLSLLEKIHERDDYIDSKDMVGSSPLHYAANKGCLESFEFIIERSTEKNPQIKLMGVTPLHLAAEKGHLEICKTILQNCQNKNPVLGFGITPLHEAALYGHFEVFKLIATSVRDVNPRNRAGYTPLHFSARKGHFEICSYIIDRVEDKNPAGEVNGTPLHDAARNGYLNICSYILERVEDKNPAGEDNETPLHYAARNGHLEICKLIIGKVSRKNPEDRAGLTPLHEAAAAGHLEICEIILKQVSDKNPIANNGHWSCTGATPMQLAAENNHTNVYNLFERFLQ
jgi:ankyrin repeat protein